MHRANHSGELKRISNRKTHEQVVVEKHDHQNEKCFVCVVRVAV